MALDEQSGVAARGAWHQRVFAVLKAVVPTTLVFLFVGPLAGYFAIMLPIALTAIDEPLGALKGIASAVAFLPIGGMVAYMIGYAPALATGFAVAVTDCVADLGQYRTPTAIVMGAGITLALLMQATGLDTVFNPEVMQGGGAIAVAVGAIAGGVSAMIAPRRVPAWRAA